MKPINTLLALLLIGSFTTTQAQQTQFNQVIWMNGKAICANPVSSIDSLTYDDNLQMDTLYTLLPRAIVRVKHDTIFQKDTVFLRDTVYIRTCDEDSRRIGCFSVSADKQVAFSAGNLQYKAGSRTWRFARHQYDIISTENAYISATYTGWIDLFGWGTGNNPTNTSSDYSEYTTFVDWGTNAIGEDTPNTWRTLSKAEWKYIFFDRPDAAKRFGWGTIDGVSGIIILPDTWTQPENITFASCFARGLSYKNGWYVDENATNNHYTDNSYSVAEWKLMEQAGAVFLPAAGCRENGSIRKVDEEGRYWSCTVNDKDDYYAGVVSFYEIVLGQGDVLLNGGVSVRLVCDVSPTGY